MTITDLLRDHKRSLATIGTASASAAVNYAIWGTPASVLAIFVLIAHEYGHYFAGYFANAEVSPPFFIPLGVSTIGATRIANLDSAQAPRVAISGVSFGTVAGVLAMALLKISSFMPITLSLVSILVYEMLWGILGGDGRRYRQAKRRM